MNKPIDPALLKSAEAFADYAANTAARIDTQAEAQALAQGARVGISRPHESAHLHVAGEATYTDDLPELAGTLHCAIGLSPVAHGQLLGIDLAALQAEPGVVAVLTAADVPGLNDAAPSPVGGDPVFAEGEIRFHGQVVFAVLAETRAIARAAARLARFEVAKEVPAVTVDQARARGSEVLEPYGFTKGDAAVAMAAAPESLAETFFVEIGRAHV